jgi:hypothetical protein
MSFTKEDNKVMDLIYEYKIIYEHLMDQSMMYKFNMNEKIYENLQVEVENLNTKKIFTASILPIGFLKDNTFFWGMNDENRSYFKNNLFSAMNKMKISQNVLITIEKFFVNNSIEFNHNYRQTIPLLLSLLYDCRNINIIRFATDETTENFAYYSIVVPITLDKKNNMLIELILDKLERFNTNKISRSISYKKISKRISKKILVHRIRRSVNKLFFK